MKTAFRIAFRHLGFKHQGSFTSFASIAAMVGLGLGVCALVLTSSVLNGFEETISSKIAGFDGHIRIQHFLFKPVTPYKTRLDSILTASNVSFSTVAYIQEAAMVRKGRSAEGILIVGHGDDALPKSINQMMRKGSAYLQKGNIVIGDDLAAALKVKVDDKLVLVDMKSMVSISSGQRMKQATVSGIYKSGLQEYDKSVVYMTLADAQTLFQYDEKVSGYTINIKDGKRARVLASRIEETLGYPNYAITWKEKHRTLFNWLNLQKWPILIIFGMIALVGIVNIISALTMIVLEKIRSIGTLISMGMNKKTIRRIFLIKGIYIGVMGSLAGLGVALILAGIQIWFKPLSIAEDIYFMSHVPVLFDWTIIGLIVLCSFISSILAALWPTHRASSVEPAVALRYE
ncbi:MAG: ABC transporter permease [Candidatus Marinimicrobia bacterium]|jgi:lipoprotein-releasing system permease protein|nr:ABC transporter permease [Candidatus Neomarinimicrobiota bacterium]